MIILIGPSASGKTEIAKLLAKNYGIIKVVTHTTRAIRVNETKDVDYHFVSKEEFLNMINNHELIEYMTYNDNYYGTSKKEFEQNKVIIIDPKGAKAINELKLNTSFFVYLKCSKEVCLKRMINRQDKKELIQKRIDHDEEIFSLEKMDFINYIINSETRTIDDLTSDIYNHYLSFIKK